MSVRFIDENREELGVEPICRELRGGPEHLLRGEETPTLDQSHT